MSLWSERPPEVANLFNPAFCGTLLVQSIHAYGEEVGHGMPFPLTFLPLPIVLHESTRLVLPKAKTTSMVAWLQRQPEVRVGFPGRIRSLIPYTREAIIFMEVRGYLKFCEHGRLAALEAIRGLNKLEKQSSEIKQCLSKAVLIGKMLARGGQPHTIFAIWGIRP